MIDTVIITIPKSKVVVVNRDPKEPLGWDLQKRTAQYSKYVRNPSKKELEAGFYLPYIDSYSRKGFYNAEEVRISFSVTKLLYQNNVDEVEEKDFSMVISTLKERLYALDLIVQEKDLKQSRVSAIHFSKNIKLVNGVTSLFVISELNKIDVRKSFDFARARFINDGESIYIHTNSHEFTIYDKVADTKKRAKRAMDKDQTLYQRSLFDGLNKKELYEILRFEIRLKKQKMNSLLKKLGFKENPSFEEIFVKKISKSIVWHYWETIVKTNSLVLFTPVMDPLDILKQIFITNHKSKSKQATYLACLISMTKNGSGLRGYRKIITKYCGDRDWFRRKADFNKAVELIKNIKPRDWYEQIENTLNKYDSYKVGGP